MGLTVTGQNTNTYVANTAATTSTPVDATVGTDTPVVEASGNDGFSPKMANAALGNTWADAAGSDGAVALDSSPAQTSQSVDGDQVVSYAQGQSGTKVGNGECTTLAENALKNAGAKTEYDYNKHVGPNGDYKWGQPVDAKDAKPGDIIQFRDYKDEKTTTHSDGSWQKETQTRPHHTAVVVKNNGDGKLTVIEQNIHSKDNKDGSVQTTDLDFSSGTTQNGSDTVTTKTSGKFWVYRPEAK